MLDIESILTDVLLERTIGFTVNGKHFCVYPKTIGSSRLIGALLHNIHFNARALEQLTHIELIRVCEEYRAEVLRIEAYATLKGKDCLDSGKVEERIKELKQLDIDDIATLLLVVISPQRSEELKHQLGIDKELQEYNRVSKAKDTKGTYAYCGKSVYGTMISTLAEKYGWTLEYIIWGISIDNIQMLLADSVKTIYLTDEEAKKIHPRRCGSDVIKADDSKNKELILSMNWD